MTEYMTLEERAKVYKDTLEYLDGLEEYCIFRASDEKHDMNASNYYTARASYYRNRAKDIRDQQRRERIERSPMFAALARRYHGRL